LLLETSTAVIVPEENTYSLESRYLSHDGVSNATIELFNKHPEIPIAHTISRGDVSTLGAPGEERKSVPDLLNERSCVLCCQGLDKLQYIRKFDTAVVVST